MADSVPVIVALEIVTRAPEMILGNWLFCAESFLIQIWGGRQIRARVIEAADCFREDLPRENIFIRVASIAPERRHVAFVVTCPKNDRRVVAQELYNGFCFDLESIGKRIVLRIQRTGHGEILPYHNTILVAEIVENFIFVHVSAPTTDDVATNVGQHGQDFRKPLLIPGMVRIHGHPVRAHRKDSFAVYDKAELTLTVLICCAGAV